MPDVEVRRRVTDVGSEPEPARHGIRKCIARDGRGTVVHGFAVSIRTSKLEAAAQPLLHIKLKALVRGATTEGQESDTAEIRVDPHIFAGWVIRPEISSRCLRWDD